MAKSHNKLNSDAQMNVHVKDLATKSHQNKKAKPQRASAHIPSTHMRISILNTRFFGNLDKKEHLKYLVKQGLSVHIHPISMQMARQGKGHDTFDCIWKEL